VIGLLPSRRVGAAEAAVREAFARSRFAEPATFTAVPSRGAHRLAA
jgi:galactokinase